MMTRTDLQSRFLSKAGWQGCDIQTIAGDASARQYARLVHPKTGTTAILMNAPRPRNGSMKPFVNIAAHLRGLDLSAPQVFFHDLELGFLLIEDLGDDLFASVIAKTPERENRLYRTAIDVICKLHNHPGPQKKVPEYNARTMAQSTDLAFLFYSHTLQHAPGPAAQTAMARLCELLSDCRSFDKLSLRDFHAENLLWLPQRPGLACVGLIDFQDAVVTHPAYDLMSLLRDARRDVTPGLADQMISLFCKKQGYDEAPFRAEAALVSVQRNLRILGIFARLARVFEKPHYVDLIPRVWDHLQTDLHHPALRQLREELLILLPEPTASFLNHLRIPCPTPP